MTKDQVRVGEVYSATVSGKIAPVKNLSVHPRGGWMGRNETTGREIRIKTAGRLRRNIECHGINLPKATVAPKIPMSDACSHASTNTVRSFSYKGYAVELREEHTKQCDGYWCAIDGDEEGMPVESDPDKAIEFAKELIDENKV